MSSNCKGYEIIIRVRSYENKQRIKNDLESILMENPIHEFGDVEIVKIEEKEY